MTVASQAPVARPVQLRNTPGWLSDALRYILVRHDCGIFDEPALCEQLAHLERLRAMGYRG